VPMIPDHCSRGTVALDLADCGTLAPRPHRSAVVWVLVGAEVEAEVGHAVVVDAHWGADTAAPTVVDKAVNPAVETLAVVDLVGGIYPWVWDVPEGEDVSGQFLVWMILAGRRSVCHS